MSGVADWRFGALLWVGFGLAVTGGGLSVGVEAEVTVRTDFPCGSLGSFKQTAPDRFVGSTAHWIKQDRVGDQYYWFYFRIDGAANRALTFELNHIEGVYRGNAHFVYTPRTHPVVSYDKQSWQRITDVTYDADARRFTFRHAFRQGTAWVAYAHPFTLDQNASLIRDAEATPHASVSELGRSVEGRAIQMISFGTDGAADRPIVLINALQHSGENGGALVMEGLCRFLFSDEAEAEALRQAYAFHVVPMMNPDGQFHGVSRYTWAMVDLNTQWYTPAPGEPEPAVEVLAVKRWIDAVYQDGGKIALWLDLHSNTQRAERNALQSPDNILKPLADHINQHWPIIPRDRNKTRSARDYGYNTYQMMAGNVEISQSRMGDSTDFTIADYHRFGRTLALSIDAWHRELQH